MEILLLLATSVFAGILPMLCWATIVWWFDRYEKEPLHLLAISFFWGVAPAIILSTVVELVLAVFSGYHESTGSTGVMIFNFGVSAPVVEEGAKLLGLLGVFWIAQKEIDGPLDGMIYGAIVGFGFAATENILFFLSSGSVGELMVMIFLRAMVFGSLHAIFASFTGLGLAFARYARRGWISVLWAAAGFSMAVLFHSVYNVGIVFAQENPIFILLPFLLDGVGIFLLIALAFGSLMRERQTIRKYLLPYVQRGILTMRQWEASGSVVTRLLAEWMALSSLDFAKYHMISRMHTICAELAFKEKQLQLWGDDPKIVQQIAKLTAEMRGYSVLNPSS